MNGVTTIAALVNVLAVGLTQALTGAKLFLFTNSLVPSQNTIPGDITEATFTGYVEKTVVWGDVAYDLVDGAAVANGTATYSWFGPADSTGQTVKGWALVQPGSGGPPVIPNEVVASGLFAAPVSLNVPTDHLALAISIEGSGTVSVTVLP